MHNPEPTTPPALSIHNSSIPSFPLVNVQFAPNQRPPEQRKLSDLINDRIERKEFFYGIEMLSRSFTQPAPTLDYNGFGTMLPLFTSLVWLGHYYWNVTPIANVESVRFMEQLQARTIVLPHFSCFRTTRERVAEFMAMNISNILAMRGDVVEPDQDFQHASELVAEIRKLRGDTISIAVAGHPEGHPDAKTFEEDVDFLVKKVNAGADFIITQICFSSKSLIKFITACRAKGIKIPIIIGVFIPHNIQILNRMNEITRVRMISDQKSEYQSRSKDCDAFNEYAQQQAVKMIKEVFDAGLDIYGVQFYTMNNFKNVQQTFHKLLKEIETPPNNENLP